MLQGHLNEYQRSAVATATVPKATRLAYCGFKLAGEAGEVSEKLGKGIREGHAGWYGRRGFRVTPTLRDAIKKELGDVLWYVAVMADCLGFTLEEIAAGNLAKLADRKARGVLHGNGDDR